MSRLIEFIILTAISLALCSACFILSGSGQQNMFYIGVGFGMAAILVFSMAVNSLSRPDGKKSVEKHVEEK